MCKDHTYAASKHIFVANSLENHTMKRQLIKKDISKRTKTTTDPNEVIVHPDLTYRDLICTNKYMRELVCEEKKIEGEAMCKANTSKMNTNLIKIDNRLQDRLKSCLYMEPKIVFSDITWKDDYVQNPLFDIVNMSPSVFNFRDSFSDSVDSLICTDPSLFFYDYDNSIADSFKRNLLVNEFEFTPYARMPVFSFSPIFSYSNETDVWYTFGLKQKFDLIYDIQLSFTGYTAKMLKHWFGSMIDSKILESVEKSGLAEVFKGTLQRDNEIVPLVRQSYTYDFGKMFLNLVLNSQYLHWYKAPVRTPYEKIKYYQEKNYIKDRVLLDIIPDILFELIIISK